MYSKSDDTLFKIKNVFPVEQREFPYNISQYFVDGCASRFWTLHLLYIFKDYEIIHRL